jgi:hypothetical protein
MTRISLLMAAAVTLIGTTGLSAQAPTTAPAVRFEQPQILSIGTHGASPAECAPGKICVKEMKPTTKTVYSAAYKEYCLPHCSVLSHIKSCCGMGSCADGDCTVRTRHVLVKKIVPDCDKPACVLKELPAAPLPVAGPTR